MDEHYHRGSFNWPTPNEKSSAKVRPVLFHIRDFCVGLTGGKGDVTTFQAPIRFKPYLNQNLVKVGFGAYAWHGQSSVIKTHPHSSAEAVFWL